VLNSDDPIYHGFGNVDTSITYRTQLYESNTRLLLYLPSRTALILRRL